ncbi:ankyrin-like protein [Dorcoceras hygrometricum]|uniref:Ankyrin-like protein n=1 Tax=Dorcoceras hygrometricum TaxID=472368 RepID=A0A2Z7C5Y1_9LAMI|nr:ankyrin-like protein [Dorcoceras hygrometricum]
MPSNFFPLRWESTGDQWWFASPIDWAAANGHYDLVRELLYIDPNLLIKLTSLPRIRRLETVWDDEEKFSDVAKCRSQVAQKLLEECEIDKGINSLIRAGYGGWLLYTAASAGDVIFVKELLDRDPILVFGEGEYGVTDIFYAAARSKSSEVFRMLFEYALFSPKGQKREISPVFHSEMVNRAVHAAARGGNVEMLTDFFRDGCDILSYRDAQGSTVLHSASGGGQIEVVKYLTSVYDIINSVDSRGNTALNVAAYLGHLAVIEILVSTSPSSTSITNDYGDTFLHMAVAGFRTPTFRRLDRQIELMKQLVAGKIVDLEDIINVKNKDGRTVLHMAVIENIQYDIVELLMSVPYINLNLRDADGNTPLDILKQRPRSASSEILIKRLISAGGISNCQDRITRKAIVSHLRLHGIGGSPGTVFTIRDAEIFLHSGFEDACPLSGDLTGTKHVYSGEIEQSGKHMRSHSLSNAANRFKMLLRWPTKRERNPNSNTDASNLGDTDSVVSDRRHSSFSNSPISLRHQFSRFSSFRNNKRIMSVQGNLPSPSRKNKYAAGLAHGVLQMLPKSNLGSPSSDYSESAWSTADARNVVNAEYESAGPSSSNQSPNIEKVKMRHKRKSFNSRLLNNYLCFGSHGLAAENLMMNSPPRKSQSQETLVVQ